MADNKDSIKNVIGMALSVCLVSAIIVAGSAVSLKPMRLANKEQDRNKNILIAAGLFQPGVTKEAQIGELFREFELRLVDLDANRLLTLDESSALGIDLSKYDQRRASKDPDLSMALATKEDIASIGRRAQYSVAYLLKKDKQIDKIVLPIHGYGLWSVLYGFVALENDFNTVIGITFYEHGETAGLGGEVENPRWKNLWIGKEIFDADGQVALTVVKGAVNPASKTLVHEVDGLSGASLTSRGVQNLIAFWLGEQGFGPLLKNIKG
ncbi:MAG: Na(+)-translocating NADH-quinone reductase subunit C [Pseudomonadales bacterium]|nr:Na(+)-translocating NADH-quinone reductase subunit C [Pseudomonadales bacterium]